MTRSKHTSLRFSAAAPEYTAAADIQLIAARGVIELLAAVPGARRIVDLGCGTGILTRALAETYHGAEVHGVDISEAMIERARKETQSPAPIQWHAADAVSFADGGRFDLVASSSSLHWMGPLSGVFANTARLLTAGGTLAFSMMLDGTLGELHELRRHLAPSKEPASHMPCADEVLSSLKARGFRVHFHSRQMVSIHYANARDMLQRLHRQGVTGGPISRGEAPLTRKDLTRLERSYDASFTKPEGGVYASFVLLYCRAVLP